MVSASSLAVRWTVSVSDVRQHIRAASLAPYAVAGLCFVLYTAWSIGLYRAFDSTGFDLGIFEQAVRSYAEGRLPTIDLVAPGFPQLADHFSPILAVLAPFYRLWRSPETLLVAQAALLAVSIVPVTRLATRLHGGRVGAVIGLGYGLSSGLLAVVSFDFHEICFAVPLLAFAVERLALRAWGAAAAFAAPLVLVKEDLPLTVAAIGVYLFAHRQRRLGIALTAFAVVSFVVIVFVALPAASPTGHYARWAALGQQSGLTWSGIGIRLTTLLAMLAPTAFIALRSPLVLLALPTLSWRFVSNNPAYWGIQYHYSAVLMPIAFIAFADGLTRLRARPHGAGWHWLAQRAVVLCLVVTAGMCGLLPWWSGGQPQWNASQQAAAGRVLSMIPNGATVAASNRLAPHLTSRCRVLLFPNQPSVVDDAASAGKQASAGHDAASAGKQASADITPEWVVVALPGAGWPLSPAAELQRLNTLRGANSGYRVVEDEGNVVLLHHV